MGRPRDVKNIRAICQEEAVKIANMSHKSAPSAGTYGNMVAERLLFSQKYLAIQRTLRKFRYTELEVKATRDMFSASLRSHVCRFYTSRHVAND